MNNFTVKVADENGAYTLWAAHRVSFTPSQDNVRAGVHFEAPDGTDCSIERGRVFVMNAAGKTIEVIDLEQGNVYAVELRAA